MATKVGVIGLGMMGLTHLDAYARRNDVEITAISDIDPDKLSGRKKTAGNVEGQAQGGVDLHSARQYDEGMKLIADPDVELVDICLPTPMHLDFARAAIAAGKHVLVEKPLARTVAQANELVDLADATDKVVMPAMCMRFWPGWDMLKQFVADQTFGPVRSAHFRRVASHPGGPFYESGEQAGGAILDLHIHDTDFVQWCFGIPSHVQSFGYTKITGEPDHVFTHYLYDDRDTVITAEGGWAFADGFGFKMQYAVNFEEASLVFQHGDAQPLRIIQAGEAKPVDLNPAMGYDLEIEYLLQCIRQSTQPTVVTPRDAANSVAIVMAERDSVLSREKVAVSVD